LRVRCSLLAINCEQNASSQDTAQTPNRYQLRLDQYCAEREKEDLGNRISAKEPFLRAEAFWSWQINSCVQLEITGGEYWSYDLRDLTNGLFRGPKLQKAPVPLTVGHSSSYATAEGYWQPTDKTPGNQLVSAVAVQIHCYRAEKVCWEAQASIFVGKLGPELIEYDVSSWTNSGIVADTVDDLECGVGHRLSIDFASNSVIVTDYPKKLGGKNIAGMPCSAFQNATSYALQGGDILLFGQNIIFSCSSSGANSAVIAKVKEFHGDVADKRYPVWMDDGNGGPPATVKTPEHPYTRDQCEQLMGRKVAELKAW